ncbi:MAG TPA: type IV toxin-antitoxin system AbiEi family antitoxin domain-containing protein [Solirubrobacterales bacterium]|nr:type IV toxin-antitoxin system AbiEi family antitoxin domain-containing protein [Solirubrobacterales bacterium]
MGKSAYVKAVDANIAAVARQQHGVMTAQQLLGVGMSRTAISKWAGRGRLHRLHQGVYAVGHTALSREAHWMAAVLACGEGAVLSHLSGGSLGPLEAH